MDSILQSQIFFFISSVGFIILGILLAVLLVYLIRTTKAFYKIMQKVEKDIDTIGDTTKEMLEEIKDSTIFHFFFKKKRSKEKE